MGDLVIWRVDIVVSLMDIDRSNIVAWLTQVNRGDLLLLGAQNGKNRHGGHSNGVPGGMTAGGQTNPNKIPPGQHGMILLIHCRKYLLILISNRLGVVVE